MGVLRGGDQSCLVANSTAKPCQVAGRGRAYGMLFKCADDLYYLAISVPMADRNLQSCEQWCFLPQGDQLRAEGGIQGVSGSPQMEPGWFIHLFNIF